MSTTTKIDIIGLFRYYICQQQHKQQYMNLLDVYFSDLHIFGFYDTVIAVFTFNFLIYYRQ